MRNQRSSETTRAIQPSSLRQMLRTDFILTSSNSAELTHFATNFFNRSSDSPDIMCLSEISRKCRALLWGSCQIWKGLSATPKPKYGLFCSYCLRIQLSSFICQPQLKGEDVAKFAANQIDFCRPTPIPSKKGESSHDYYFNNKLPGTERPEGQFKTMHDSQFQAHTFWCVKHPWTVRGTLKKLLFQSISPQSSITTFLLVFPDLEPKLSIWGRSKMRNFWTLMKQKKLFTFLTTSMPSTIWPKTTCLPSSHSVFTVKNCLHQICW